MKPKTLVLTFAVIALILAYTIILSVQHYPMFFRRHVDPNAEAERLPYPTYLTAFLLPAFDRLLEGNFTGTLHTLKEFNQTYVPPTLKYIFERFKQLMNDLTIKLDDTDSLLDYAELLIDSGKEEYAKTPLNKAGYNLAEANITYSLLKTSAQEFIKSFSLPRTQLFQKVDDIETLLESMRSRLYALIDRIEFQRNLKETFLEIEVYPEKVWVGSTVVVEGKLYTHDKVLSQKNLIIYFDGQKVSEVKTSSDGTLKCTIKVPYVYKPTVNVVAKYVPEKDDKNVYKPTVSDTTKLNLLYIMPKIEVKLLGAPLPGKYFKVEGKVYAERPIPYNQIRILWLTGATITKLENETFNLTIKVPETLSEGNYMLKAESPSWEIYAPASTTVYVKVQRIPLNLSLQVPPIAITGIESSVLGKITYEGEERFNSTIKFILAQEYVESAAEEFTIKFKPPLTMFSGYQVYRVQVSPQLPWYRSLEFEGRIFVLNPVTVAVPLGLVSFMAVKVLRRGKGKKVEALEGEAETVEEAAQEKEHYYVREGLEWLINVYWQAVVIVSNMTRIEMKPSMTIREYLNLVKESGKEFYKGFERISIVAEKVLYSPSVSEEELKMAKDAIEELQIIYARIR